MCAPHFFKDWKDDSKSEFCLPFEIAGMEDMSGISIDTPEVCVSPEADQALESSPPNTMMRHSCIEPESDSGTGSDQEEPTLPPPQRYYTRDVQSEPALLRRTKSEILSGRNFYDKEVLASRQMNQSMPNLCSSRAQHNRRIGSTSEFRANKQGDPTRRSRAAEFEALFSAIE